jgi:hypothetical protein
MTRSKVAVLKTRPETVLQDIEKLMKLAEFEKFLDKNSITILKDNISWHFPYLSSNTTPWQLEGAIIALKNAGYDKLVAVHNNTVVTDPFKGCKLNKLTPIYKKYGVEEKYNFLESDIKWVRYEPKHKMLAFTKYTRMEFTFPNFSLGRTSCIYQR